MSRCPSLASRCFFALALTPWALADAAAQNTLVVDINNGPGTNFTEIQPAVDKAQPGDRILIRGGNYTGFSVSKPLAIVGDGTAVIRFPAASGDAISISGIAADQRLVLRDLTVVVFSGEGIGIRNCQGNVLLDSVRELLATHDNEIEDCAQVMLNQCNYYGNNVVTRSTVMVSGGGQLGSGSLAVGGPGMDLTDSNVFLARASVSGGGALSGQPGAGIRLTNSQVTITGDASNRVAPGLTFTTLQAPVIEGDGTATIDPEVSLSPAFTQPGQVPFFGPGVTVTTAQVPALTASGDVLGGQGSVSLVSEPGDSYSIYIGNPGTAMAGAGGVSWLAPGHTHLFATGVVDASGTVTLSYPVPNMSILVGEPVYWIAAAGSSSMQLSNNAGHSYSF